MEGKTLGNYQIVNLLGRGGMGAVYLGRDLTLKRQVAIKVIDPHFSGQKQLMMRFKVEAIAQARLNHSNIVTIHAFDQQQDIYYIVMEHVQGKTLKALLDEQVKLPVNQALSIVLHILDGLAYAHKQGVLHRDIKPANIFITPDHEVKIGDFGIAKVEGIDGLTRVGSAIGTPMYSSPEQILGKKITAAADIYSLGVTLYEMLTGATPFKSPTGSNFEVQQAHLSKIPSAPSGLNPVVSQKLDKLILKTLAKTPGQRFPHAEGLKQAISNLLGESNRQGAGKRHKMPELSFTIPLIKLPSFNLSALKKIQLKLPGTSLKGAAPDRRILVLILIPLLILLLIIAAYAEQPCKTINIKADNQWSTSRLITGRSPSDSTGGKNEKK